MKMATCRHIDNSSIIVAECMTLRNCTLVANNKGFLDLEIKEYMPVTINYDTKIT